MPFHRQRFHRRVHYFLATPARTVGLGHDSADTMP
jgi:hypothetical protein